MHFYLYSILWYIKSNKRSSFNPNILNRWNIILIDNLLCIIQRHTRSGFEHSTRRVQLFISRLDQPYSGMGDQRNSVQLIKRQIVELNIIPIFFLTYAIKITWSPKKKSAHHVQRILFNNIKVCIDMQILSNYRPYSIRLLI